MPGNESTRTPIDPQVNPHAVDAIIWHAQPAEDVYNQLQTSPDGLSQSEAEARLAAFGPNTLPAPQPPTLLQVVLHQFTSPLIYILLIAAIVALAIGDFKDAAFIFAVLALNASIGTFQEWRAEQQAHALQTLLKIQATVRRGGRVQRLPADALVPGDIVLIESGDKVPADLRLVREKNLAIDESFLTGESVAVDKHAGEVDEETPVSDRRNMAYAGATVMTGRGTGIVVATGVHTEVGQIATSITETTGAKPPLLIRMELFARQISVIVLVLAALLGLLMFSRGVPFADVFVLMVAMAVSAIPEGLPVALTVALSIATSRMAQRNVVVRKLMAVESLGSCTTIASDKTGTLTVNQQTVKKLVFPDGVALEVSGQGYNDEGKVSDEAGEAPHGELGARFDALVQAGMFCNEASLVEEEGEWRHTGDAMDVALLALAYKAGYHPEAQREQIGILGAIPFESERRYAAIAYRTGEDATVVAVKGAVEAILPFCATMRTAAGDEALDEQRLLDQADALAQDGYRVLAVAAARADADSASELSEGDLHGLALLGLLGFIDPLRPEVKAAVDDARAAGVRVIMITGDHPATALAIARQLGIADGDAQVITGKELEAFGEPDSEEFAAQIKDVLVFARVTPQQKLFIVDALVNHGEFVAVTGDGVNDAPALRSANIGVAMGSGTDIAKDTALITVVDDNFASIVAGIEEGRYAYANVRKVTLLLISTGAAELVLLGSSVILGFPAPLLAVQILWLNLVTNGIQDVALAFEAGEKGVMKHPPRRPSEGIFNRKMVEQVLVAGLVMGVTCLVAWVAMLNSGMDEDVARNNLLTLLVLMQFYHVLNCRSETVSAFRVPLRNNPILMIGMVAAFALYVVATELPFFQSLLRTQSLPLQTWLILAGLAGVVLAAMEIYKVIQKHSARKVV